MSNSLQPHGLQSTSLLYPWFSPGKNTGVGFHALLQGIFLTQVSNPGLPHLQVGSLPLTPPGKPLAHSRFSLKVVLNLVFMDKGVMWHYYQLLLWQI